MSREHRNRRRNTPQYDSVQSQADAVVDARVQLILLNANAEMQDINITPRGYPRDRKEQVASDLNWACEISLHEDEITGRFTIGNPEGGDGSDAFIYLKPKE